MQHKNNFDELTLFEYSEGQQGFLCCNKTSSGCPSLHLSYNQAKQNLLERGMTKEDFDGLLGFLKGLTKQLLDEQINTITNFQNNNGHE